MRYYFIYASGEHIELTVFSSNELAHKAMWNNVFERFAPDEENEPTTEQAQRVLEKNNVPSVVIDKNMVSYYDEGTYATVTMAVKRDSDISHDNEVTEL